MENIRYYNKNEVVYFRKTHDDWGGLSNMASGYPIQLNNTLIRNSEVLYQAFRFPNFPEIQKEIFNEVSPMTAKMKSKKYLSISRNDWNKVRVSIMRWVLRAKLASNFQKFSQLLLNTGHQTIVEYSSKDDFWGAYLKEEVFVGQNVLGRLLMELREEIRTLNKFELIRPKFDEAIILNKNLAKECHVNKNNIIKYEELFM
jgi:ribA/ribD-fused uncharacterized protein